jgi:sulfite reductase (ferredoxin)
MVHTDALASTLRPLLVIWRDERQPGEKFGDFAYRVGVEYLHARVAKDEATEAHI